MSESSADPTSSYRRAGLGWPPHCSLNLMVRLSSLERPKLKGP